MNFLPESVNHRFITYSDSQVRKNRDRQTLQISTDPKTCSHMNSVPVILSDLSQRWVTRTGKRNTAFYADRSNNF